MKIFFHKIAAYTVVVFISAQPISIDVFAAEKEPAQDITFLDDDKAMPVGKRKSVAESSLQMGSDKEMAVSTPTEALVDSKKSTAKPSFWIPRYLAKKAANFMAWFNTDIEADLH